MIEFNLFDKIGFKVTNDKTYGEVVIHPRNEEQEQKLLHKAWLKHFVLVENV